MRRIDFSGLFLMNILPDIDPLLKVLTFFHPGQSCDPMIFRLFTYNRLDISRHSLHTKRRIWQESITTLFLTSPGCEIPKGQTMDFAQSRDSEFPPFLLNFGGNPGERHVENLKVA